MSIVDALTIPLGLPVTLIRDQLNHGVPAAAILAPEGSLLADFQNAYGYAYRWGDIIEARSTAALAWHFVPVELWEETDELRRASEHAVAELIPELQPVVVAALRDRLPAGIMLIGCHPYSRRASHVLFSLVLVDRGRETAARRWLVADFLPCTWPGVLRQLHTRLDELCGPRSHGV